MILTRIKESTRLKEMFPDKVIGFVSGCWDLTHSLHNQTFRRCRAKCDFLLVGVDADDLVAENKGKMPATPDFARMDFIADLVSVDAVIRVDSLEIHNQICDCVDRVFKNSDTIYGNPVEHGSAELVIVPDIEFCQSTTAIKQKVRKA